ncbi:M56 family metallopeptidase [Dyadobacter sp. CY107]|uniref:M56 family metallopeptidase n=1 Tax=Dyadobacter fanqingshengii TaxID=2906443 RepID=UPI001F2AF221|nr:M56 family metallopeptidase [Dyadobacter fanqingshengii]MCF2505196.1 M56 family metallopeptidase [Dyadobacter fanqingshengii]
MEQLPYLAKVNLCWLVFAGCYWLLFRKHTFFKLNRAYLLATLIISLFVPALQFVRPVYVMPYEVLEASFTYRTVTQKPILEQGADWGSVALAVYLAGVLVLLFHFCKGLYGLNKLLKSALQIPMDGLTLVLPAALPSKRSGSFSFRKFMIVSPNDYENHFETIFNHEAVHIKQMHSLDILLVEVLKIVFWFNPALWLYKFALRETHEYLADEGAENRDGYAAFLISYARHAPIRSISNQFFNSSLLKKRIYMMYKDRTPRWLRGKYLLLVPIFAFTVMLLAAQVRPALLNKQSQAKPEQDVQTATNPGEENRQDMPLFDSEKIRKDVKSNSVVIDSLPKLKLERWPYFSGGTRELHKFLARNLIYPAKALKDSVQGQALVSFLLNEDGVLSDIRIEKGPRQDINEEAARVVALMPRWVPAIAGGKPVAVRYSINITFDIESDKLPLSIKEKVPDFYSRKQDYVPLKLDFPGGKDFEKFFSSSAVDLSDSMPPATKIHRYGMAVSGWIDMKHVDMNVKIK